MKLEELYSTHKIELSPPYQRNSIWSLKAQKLLIDTIKRELPLPNFFLQKKGDGFEMVDGQQRTRALLSYTAPNGFEDNDGQQYQEGQFNNYEISVVILSEALSIDQIREFYVRVNRSGARLERPELNKAEFFKSRFLKLSTDLSEIVEFRELKIFKTAQIRRMFDRDFIEEIAAMIIHGPTDKKITVDQMFENDITEEQAQKIKTIFKEILERISFLNFEYPLSESRFTQKNDFYTFFNLLMGLQEVHDEDLKKIYKILLFISKGISPSNEECPPLKEYALNCVSQSNSKKARTKRLDILHDLLLNESPKVHTSQKSVMDHFKLPQQLERIDKYYTFSLNK